MAWSLIYKSREGEELFTLHRELKAKVREDYSVSVSDIQWASTTVDEYYIKYDSENREIKCLT